MHKMLSVRQVQFREACSQLLAQGKRPQYSAAPRGRPGFISGGVRERGTPRPLLTCPGPMQRGGGEHSKRKPPPKGVAHADKEQGMGGRECYHGICFVCAKLLWAAEKVESRERDCRCGQETARPAE